MRGPLLWAVCALAAVAVAHTCIHDELMAQHKEAHGVFPHEAVAPTKLEYLHDQQHATGSARKMLSTPTRGPIRFYVDYTHLDADDTGRTCFAASGSVNIGVGGAECLTASQTDCSVTCTELNTLSAAKKAHIKDVLMPAATSYLSGALQSVQVVGVLSVSLSSAFCTVRDAVTINVANVSDADIILIVTARPTVESLIAFAGACRTDATNRPIMANVNFGPTFVETGATASVSEFGTAIHELMHALGFTYTQFSKYWNYDTNSPRGLAQIQGVTIPVTQLSSPSTDPYTATYQPKVVNASIVRAEAAAHYGCPALAGMPLENQGGSGTALSHWEKKVAYNEIMAGSSSGNPIVSRMTLALFEEMGWYTADYTKAGSLLWGKNAGCAFIDNKCMTDNQAWQPYLCSVADQRSCNFDRTARASCLLVNDATTPTEMRYFGAANTLGGAETLADYCPVTIEFTTGYCNVPANADPTSDVFFAEAYTVASSCFDSTLGQADTTPNARCYVSGCLSATELAVVVGTREVRCTDTLEFSVSSMANTASCPDAAYIASRCGSFAAGEFPSVASVSPSSVAATGGTTVTVTGQGLDAVVYVSVGGAGCAAPFLSQTADSIQCELGAPSMPPSLLTRSVFGAGVVVVTEDGTAGLLESVVTVVGTSSPAAVLAAPLAFVLAALVAVLALA